MTKQKILLSLLLTCSIGMVKAQTVEIDPNGVEATHNEVLCTGGTVTFTFSGTTVTATSDYGASAEFTATTTPTVLTLDETTVETMQLRTPEGFSYSVGSYVATNNLDFSGVKGNSTIGTVIRPYIATGCTSKAITLEGQTIISGGDGFVMSGDIGWYCVPVTTSQASYTTNKFLGSTTEAFTSDGTQYALSSAGTFRKVQSGVSIPATRAYFVPTTAAAAKLSSLDLDFEGTEATGIDGIETEKTSDAIADGKYLIDGQIVIVRGGMKYNANGLILK